MIVCPRCSKENQDHYKFCLGCGAELAREPAKPLHRSAPLGSSAAYGDDYPTDQATQIGTGAGVVFGTGDEVAGMIACTSCGADNSASNRFCASCGFRLADGSVPAEGVVMLTALSPDGEEAGCYQLPPRAAIIGRDTGSIFSGDYYLSPQHARFTPQDGSVLVEDVGSLNGVFRRLEPEQRCRMRPGQVFRIGQQLIKFEELEIALPDENGVEVMGAPREGYVGRIAMVLGRETTGTAFPIPETGLNLGRERGEVLFADDGYVSGLHCRISYEQGHVYLTDLGSSNGTFVRLMEEEELYESDILLMGQQLFLISM